MDPLSPYDIIYKGMSPAESELFRSEIDKILIDSAANAEAALLKGMQKAMMEMYESRIANPWIDILNNCNADLYGFFEALSTQLWKSLINESPKAFVQKHQWSMYELFRAWMQHYPDELKEVVNKEMHKQYDALKQYISR